MHTMQLGQSAISTESQLTNGMSVGTFELPNGGNVNKTYFEATITDPVTGNIIPNPNLVDTSNMQMVYDFGLPDQRPAKVSDVGGVRVTMVAPILAGSNAGQLVQINGANNGGSGTYDASLANNGIYNMNSTMNYDQVSHDWRTIDRNPSSVVTNEGVNPADPTKMDVAFEDQSGIRCYFTNSGACVGTVGSPPRKPPAGCTSAACDPNWATDAALDQFGGYMAYVGDNDYDDVAVSMTVTQCPLQN
jgi:hypothetical protein